MEGNQETDSLISMEILLDKLIAIESRMADNFSNLHTQISELTCEFKHEINVVKSTTFRSEDEDDYEYEFSVLSTRTSKNVGLQTLCACSVRKTRICSRPRPPI